LCDTAYYNDTAVCPVENKVYIKVSPYNAYIGNVGKFTISIIEVGDPVSGDSNLPITLTNNAWQDGVTP
jgi:hypothetical protein